MTKSGIKTEDYRDINDYWFKRLVFQYEKVFKYTTGYDWNYLDEQSRFIYLLKISKDPIKKNMIGFKPIEKNIMTLGYPKKGDLERTLIIEHKGIEIRMGNPEWGAIPNKPYFVIKHGTIL